MDFRFLATGEILPSYTFHVLVHRDAKILFIDSCADMLHIPLDAHQIFPVLLPLRNWIRFCCSICIKLFCLRYFCTNVHTLFPTVSVLSKIVPMLSSKDFSSDCILYPIETKCSTRSSRTKVQEKSCV